MATEKENTFIDSIDCQFPYNDKPKCIQLINEAITISANATFSVAEQICRVPPLQRHTVESGYQLELLTYTRNQLKHPLTEVVFTAAEKMIKGQKQTEEEAANGMEKVKEHPGQFAALTILYFSAPDSNGRLDALWDAIMDEWRK